DAVAEDAQEGSVETAVLDLGEFVEDGSAKQGVALAAEVPLGDAVDVREPQPAVEGEEAVGDALEDVGGALAFAFCDPTCVALKEEKPSDPLAEAADDESEE